MAQRKNSIELKEILFSQQCYQSPISQFPEAEETLCYNPCLDALFGNSQKGAFLQLHHEFCHGDLFRTKSRAYLQLLASLCYEILANARHERPQASFNVPSLDNWVALKKVRSLMKALYESSHEVEEIIAIYNGLYGTELLFKQYKEHYPYERTPTEIKQAVIEEEKTKFGDDFRGEYNRFKRNMDRIGKHASHVSNFILNIPLPSTFFGIVLKAVTKTQQSDKTNSKKRNLIAVSRNLMLKVPGRKPLESLVKQVTKELKKYPLSPKARLDRVLSAIEDIKFVGIRKWGSEEFVLVMESKLPGFFRDCSAYQLELLPGIKEVSKLDRYYKLGNIHFMANLIVLRNKLKRQYDHTTWCNAMLKGDIKTVAELEKKMAPCSLIEPTGTLILNPNLRADHERPAEEYINLLFFESLRQQLFQGTGLKCPENFFNQDCYSIEKYGECKAKNVLKFIWEHVKLEDNGKVWAKPQCL